MNDKERIEAIRQHADLTWKALSLRLGMVSPQTFTDIRGGKHGISKTLAEKLSREFPEIQAEWIAYGRGEMMRPAVKKGVPLYDGAAPMEGANSKGLVDFGSCFPLADSALLVSTDAMTEYPAGCVLALRTLQPPYLFVPGECYVVETSSFRAPRRVQKGSEPGEILLRASCEREYAPGHRVHEPFTIPLTSVVSAHAILGYVMSAAPGSPFLSD